MKGKRTITDQTIRRQCSIIRSALYGQFCAVNLDYVVFESAAKELAFIALHLRKGVPFASSDTADANRRERYAITEKEGPKKPKVTRSRLGPPKKVTRSSQGEK